MYLGLFFAIDPVMDSVFGALRMSGISTFHLDGIWPGVTDVAWVSLLLYLVVFEFVDYWIHRGQHQIEWWWRLHSLHHSQQQMTMWSDNRNHLLDDMLRDTILVVVAQLIGVAPGQFVAIVAVTQLSESLQHANLRLAFGRVGERLWISPRFHRLHHSIGIGHETAGKGTLGGHNFGVLLPWWDMLFRTVNFEDRYDPTGVIGYSNYYIIDSVGFSGGIWVLWNQNKVDLHILDSSPYSITTSGVTNGKDWTLNIIYVSLESSKRRSFWSYLDGLPTAQLNRNLYIGDFNEILCPDEKFGGSSTLTNTGMLSWIERNALIDLGFLGSPFTWIRNNMTGNTLRERLDRVVCSNGWNLLFPNANITHLHKRTSDHCPLLLKFNDTRSYGRNLRPKPFRFNNMYR